MGQDRPAPVNYGLVEGLLNPADGEEVDAVYLGPPLSPGEEAEGLLLGMVALADGDHKLLLAQSPEGLDPKEAARLLAWFSPERRPTLLGPEEAGAWVKGLKERQDRRLGAFLGLAVGDALGAQVEGLPKGTFPEVREMKGGGPTAFPPGSGPTTRARPSAWRKASCSGGLTPRTRWTATCAGTGRGTGAPPGSVLASATPPGGPWSATPPRATPMRGTRRGRETGP